MWQSTRTACDTEVGTSRPAGMAKLADAADLKSADPKGLWGFKSPSRHHTEALPLQELQLGRSCCGSLNRCTISGRTWTPEPCDGFEPGITSDRKPSQRILVRHFPLAGVGPM